MKLENMTALVPGASRPIGRAIARRLAAEKVNLILPTFDWPASIQEMEEEFSTAGVSFLSLPVDLRSRAEVKELVTVVTDRFGGLNILVNNIERGGMPVVHGSYDLPHNRDQWDLELSTTLKAKWLLFHHFFPLMKDSGKGCVLNISSVSGICGRSGAAAPFFNDAYAASNRAISSFTETWAREAAPLIRVNELMLGLIQNRHGENTRGWQSMNEDEKNAVREQCLLQRTGTPEEVADSAMFLIRDARYITGCVLRMDGGLSLGSQRVPPFPGGILNDD